LTKLWNISDVAADRFGHPRVPFWTWTMGHFGGPFWSLPRGLQAQCMCAQSATSKA